MPSVQKCMTVPNGPIQDSVKPPFWYHGAAQTLNASEVKGVLPPRINFVCPDGHIVPITQQSIDDNGVVNDVECIKCGRIWREITLGNWG